MDIELSEIAFIVYTCLIIFVLENYKEDYKPNTKHKEQFTEEAEAVYEEGEQEKPTEKVETVGAPQFGFLPRNKYVESPLNKVDSLENSYNQATTLLLMSPWTREEACLPIEGNIGTRIELATEIFGPFERRFIL